MPEDDERNWERNWRQYELATDLLKSYTDMILKLNIFYYAVTGGIVSFYFAKAPAIGPQLRWSLAIPIIMSVLLATLCWISLSYVDNMKTVLDSGVKELQLGSGPPTTGVLKGALWISLVLFALCVIVLSLCICCDPGMRGAPHPEPTPNLSFQLRLTW